MGVGSMTIRIWYFREGWWRLLEHLPWGMGLGQGYANPDHLHGIDPHDYWLLDEETVAFNVFADDGSSFGARLVADPATVDRCIRVRDEVIAVGIPHEDYHIH